MALYTWETARSEVQARLGGRTDIVTGAPQDRLSRWLNAALLLLVQSDIDIPAVEATSGLLPLVIGQAEYNLTTSSGGGFNLTNVLGIRLVKNVTNGENLEWMSWLEYRDLNTQASGPPVRWTRKGHILAFDPKPAAATNILIDYRRAPTVDTLADFEDRRHEEIIEAATFYGWTALRQYEEAAKVKSLLPQYLRVFLELPMGRADWEARAGVYSRVIPER